MLYNPFSHSPMKVFVFPIFTIMNIKHSCIWSFLQVCKYFYRDSYTDVELLGWRKHDFKNVDSYFQVSLQLTSPLRNECSHCFTCLYTICMCSDFIMVAFMMSKIMSLFESHFTYLCHFIFQLKTFAYGIAYILFCCC